MMQPAATMEEGRVPLASGGAVDEAVERHRRRAKLCDHLLVAVFALDFVLTPLMLLAPFSFQAHSFADDQIKRWSFESSVFDWAIFAMCRDVAGVALALVARKQNFQESFVRAERRVCVLSLVLGVGRFALLDRSNTGKSWDAFIPTVALGAATALLASAIGFQLVRTSDALHKSEEPEPAAAEGEGGAETAQYSSALSAIQTLKVLKPYFWPSTGSVSEIAINRFRAVMTWVFVGLSKVASIISPIFLARATNGISALLQNGPGPTPVSSEVIWNLVIYAFLSFISKALKEAQSLIYIKVQQAAYIEIADRTFHHLHNLSLDWHLRKKMGNVVRSMDRGVQAAQQTMQYVFLYLFPTLAEAVAVTLIFVFHFQNYRLAIFVGLNLYLYIYATVKITLWRKRFRSATTKHDNALHDRLTDSLVNYETIKYFTAEEYERREYRTLVEKFQKYSMATQASLSVLNVLQQVIVNFALAGGMIIATWRVLQEHGALGDFVAVNAYIINVFTPLNFLGTIYNMVVNAVVDMHNFGQLLAETAEVTDKPHAPDADMRPHEGVPMVEFRRVCFSYAKQAFARSIKDICFSVPRGSSMALVGTTGAGKTTVTRLLFRFYDVTSGSVLLNGQDVRDISQRSLRRAIGMVPQDVVMFNSTIAHNIKYGLLGSREDVTMEEIEKAAENAQLAKFISQQAQGYETMVGERGLKLSGGEKQRLAIARCFLKDPPVVVLDEATSALDSETEQKVQQALETLSNSRTVIAIAHRLSTIRHFDEILVLEGGEIQERGTHDALMAKTDDTAKYAPMWRRQAAGMDEPSPTNVEATGAGLGMGTP